MTKLLRLILLPLASAFPSAPALATPVAASPGASVSARIVRPLKLTGVRDLDLGTALVVGTVTGVETLGIDINGTLRVCAPSLICSGAFQSARFNVQGTRNAQIRFIVRPSWLTNLTSGGGEQIEFRPSFFATHTLIHDGAPGLVINVGGQIVLRSTPVEGVYRGELEATVDYL